MRDLNAEKNKQTDYQTPTECLTDLRVIHLYRQQQSRAPRESRTPVPGNWVALGHFDRISIETLAQGSGVDLQRIRDSNQAISISSSDYYDQPIYIMQTISKDGATDKDPFSIMSQINRFWEHRSAFLLISRIHTTAFNQVSIEKSIERCLNQQVEGVCPVSARSGSNASCSWDAPVEVPYLRYRTLEFSDIVLIAKSNSVELLLKMIGQLYYLPDVGDIYSYFAISYSELQERDSTKLEACNTDIIPITMTRFAVRDARKGRNYLDIFKTKIKKQYFDLYNRIKDPIMITGMEDLMLVSEGLCSRDLIIFLQYLLPEDKPIAPFSGLNVPDFWDAFDGMTTRLSILESKVAPKSQGSVAAKSTNDTDSMGLSSAGSSIDLNQVYRRLKDKFYKFYSYKQVLSAYPDWLRPTAELIKSLSNISSDSILRQLCYTVLDGVEAVVLLGKQYFLQYDQAAYRDIVEMLQKTSSGIASLMEQMVRMEGELVHHPETRPLMYDIPANLLELYSSFSDHCLNYLQRREWDGPTPTNQEKNKCYLLLVVPGLCSNISVSNMVSDRTKPYTFLYIDMPIHLLYEPAFVLRSLTHEVAHFSSEKTRMRDLRFQMFTFGVSSHFLHLFPRIDNNDNNREQERQWYLLRDRIPVNKRKYSNDLVEELIHVVDDMLQNSGEYERLLQCPEDRKYIHDVIRELNYLFKEAYADLVMISLLNLKDQEYIEIIAQDQSEWDDAMRASSVERVASVIIAKRKVDSVGNEEYIGLEQNILDNNKLRGFSIEIEKYLIWFQTEKKREPQPRRYHRFQAIYALVYYLSECYRSIKMYDEKHDEDLKMVRSYYDDFARKNYFASSKFYCFLEDHRKKLLEKHTAM